MDFSTILIIIGIISIIASFFLKDTSKRLEKEVEELSIQLYQETNTLKRRVKILEEELMLGSSFQMKEKNTQNDMKLGKPVPQILVQQVIELNKQGYPIDEIRKLSTLSKDQILHILKHGGQS